MISYLHSFDDLLIIYSQFVTLINIFKANEIVAARSEFKNPTNIYSTRLYSLHSQVTEFLEVFFGMRNSDASRKPTIVTLKQ